MNLNRSEKYKYYLVWLSWVVYACRTGQSRPAPFCLVLPSVRVHEQGQGVGAVLDPKQRTQWLAIQLSEMDEYIWLYTFARPH